MATQRFYFKYCETGHMLYSPHATITTPNCDRCGTPYVDKCADCGNSLFNMFTPSISYIDKKPLSIPKRPDFCHECGKPHPWTKAKIQQIEVTGIWTLLHKKVAEFAKPRFVAGHYADAVEAAFKELNSTVQTLYKARTGDEYDGVNLMRKAFTPQNPVIVLDSLNTETGKNIQQGYMELFAGSMAGIRNPKAHGNLEITAERAMHHLTLCSLLFFKLDERIE
jgi:uncharacterized protein (TIGR02391 family)